MRHPTQFNLRTLFVLLFCFCVGLTGSGNTGTYTSNWQVSIESLPWIIYESLLLTGATAMVIGLIQQVVLLRQAKREGLTDRPALGFAVGWRMAVAILLAGSIVLTIELERKLFDLPEGPQPWLFFYTRLIPEYFLLGCMIIVLTDSLKRPVRSDRRRRPILGIIVWALAALAALFVVAQGMRAVYYVYRALAGVEMAQSTEFRRPGAYPSFQTEGYGLFWMAAAAVALAVMGAATLLSVFSRMRRKRGGKAVAATIGLVLLGLSAAFGYWYRLVAFPTISPDFAEAGLMSSWWDWVEAAALLGLVVPVAAYRLTADPSHSTEVNLQTSRDPVLHQSLLVSFILALAAGCYLATLLLSMFDAHWGGTGLTLWQRFYWTFADVNVCVPLAVCLLSFQLLWKLWRTPPLDNTIRITPISMGRFLFACLALVVILVLSIPTIYAFCFTSWLVPWPYSLLRVL